MIKRQNHNLILFIFFLFTFISISYSAVCESTKEKLTLADSLFKEKKYTQSYELYESILESDKKASPSMLLKMAFIKEGLGDITNALYYLDLYYLQTYDKKALKKMESLAEEKKLKGYNYDDIAFFLNMYHQYQMQVDLIIVAVIILLFLLLLYRKKKKLTNSPFPGIAFVLLLIALLFINNYGREKKKAIISAPTAYLMKGPSPGSELIQVVTEGHRVDILGQDDVWVKISWDDKPAYIKNFELKPID
jgi:hypothetical protein